MKSRDKLHKKIVKGLDVATVLFCVVVFLLHPLFTLLLVPTYSKVLRIIRTTYVRIQSKEIDLF